VIAPLLKANATHLLLKMLLGWPEFQKEELNAAFDGHQP